MGIEIELHSTRPATSKWKASRETLIHGAYENGSALAAVLAKLDPSHRLKLIDPYSDTVINEQVAEAAFPHCQSVLDLCESEQQVAAVAELAEMLRRCASTPGSHLWFIGD
ncbi:hypothetical protein [Flindersiella endophytica]